MDASTQALVRRLDAVDVHGWDSPQGRGLLDQVRTEIVRPLVRRSGVRGAGADQAEATGWQAAWDVLRRPATRMADNPGGMVWVAVRRAIWAEVGPTPGGGRSSRGGAGHGRGSGRTLSLDTALQVGWDPPERRLPNRSLGPRLEVIVAALEGVGWDRVTVTEAITLLAEEVGRCRDRPRGAPRTPWRRVAGRLGLPEWQVRRLGTLIVGAPTGPGLLELLVTHGSGVLADPVVLDALRSTRRRTSASPGTLLTGWSAPAGARLRHAAPAMPPGTTGIWSTRAGPLTLCPPSPLSPGPEDLACDGDSPRTGDGACAAVPGAGPIALGPTSARPVPSRAPQSLCCGDGAAPADRPGPSTHAER